jgi:hypothetical protein
MPTGQIDPARLEGEELGRWYLRSPRQIEEEREAAAAKKRAEFYGGTQPQPTRFREASLRPVATQRALVGGGGSARYGNLAIAPTGDLSDLRREQAEFERKRREISRENSWMAVPALAPAAAVFGLEATAAIAARVAPQVIPRAPLVLTKRDPYLRVGDHHAARVGRRVDKYYKDMARAKDGWKPDPTLKLEGKTLKPDLAAPARTSDPAVRRYIEIKPNTPSGRAAAARQIKKYKEASRQNVRALFYDPKKFM